MRPASTGKLPWAAATSLLPSDEDAIEAQLVKGALVCVHAWLRVGLVTVNKPLKTAAARSKCSIFMMGPSVLDIPGKGAIGCGHHSTSVRRRGDGSPVC